jgi:hypothetical protein
MNKIIFYIFVFFLFTGCESIKQGLGMEKNLPDEFLIKKYDPIQRPPDFELLPPGTKTKVVKKNNSKNIKNLIENNLKKNQESEIIKDKTQNLEIENEILKELNK